MTLPRYEVFPDKAGGWRWRLKARNGHVVAQSEGYPTKDHAQRGARAARSVSFFTDYDAVEVAS